MGVWKELPDEVTFKQRLERREGIRRADAWGNCSIYAYAEGAGSVKALLSCLAESEESKGAGVN